MVRHRKCCILPKQAEGKLKRTLSLLQVTICGTGIILGAGIYALIGEAANMTGNAVWLSFFISAVIAALTGLSYAELSSILKKDGGEYDYTERAFNKKAAIIVGIMVLLTGVFSGATVAIAFGRYLSTIISGLSTTMLAIAVIAFCSIINYVGIKQSAIMNTLCTAIEAIGLLIIIALGVPKLGSVNLLEMPNGWTGVFQATALVFFAYMGFETIVKLTEETKNPSKNIPLGIVYSLIITTIIYVLVSLSALSILDWQTLGSSQAPLAQVAATSLGQTAFLVIAVIALFSTSNTILMTVVTTSRLVYGMAEQSALPRFLARVNPLHHTPTLAILFTGLVTAVLVFMKELDTVANFTNLFLFATFAIVNISVIALRYKDTTRRPFKVPLNMGNFPILSAIGALSCIGMLWFVVMNLL